MGQSRPFLGCRRGTFSPSPRQIRSTRLGLTSQPAARNKAVILWQPQRPDSRASAMTSAGRAASSFLPRHLAPVSSGADQGRNRRSARGCPLQLDALATGARARRGSGAPPVQGGTSPPDRVRDALPSPGGLRQEALVQREIRGSLAEPLVLELQLL